MTDHLDLTKESASSRQDAEMFVDAFARGLQVIRSFNDGPENRTLSDIARHAKISRASTRRLLHTLCQLGYMDYDGKFFRLKPRILDLGYAYMSSQSLAGVATDAMQELATAMNASCSLGVLDNGDVVYHHRVEVRAVTTCSNKTGFRIPAHLLAMGRIQLAALSDDALRDYVSGTKLVRYTPYTVTDPGTLEAIIRADGERGWSMVLRELDEGMCSMAMPIRGREGQVVAGLGLGLRPDLSNDPATIDFARQALARAVESINDLLRMRG